MIVLDASAAVAGLLTDGPARAIMAREDLHALHLVDPEVAHAVRRRVGSGRLDGGQGWSALDTWRRLGLRRYAGHLLLERVWQLRDDLSAYDATYVALAEALGCALVTADGRLARAPGLGCAVTVVPR